MKNKKILIISEYIAPVQAVASIRWTKFAKYLAKENGCEVTVLTNAKSYKRGVFQSKPYAKDPALEKDMRWFTTVEIPHSVGQAFSNVVFNLGRNALDALKSRSAGGAQRHAPDTPAQSGTLSGEKNHKLDAALTSSLPERIYELVDGWCGRALVRAGARARVEWDSFDVMISTYGPLWPHLLAADIKGAHCNVLWVADFRDPIVNSVRTDTPSNRRLAQEVTSRADLITAVSQGTLENLYLDGTCPSVVLVNGFDPDEVSVSGRQRSDCFLFVYTGTLYSDDTCRRDLSPLFMAIEEASRRGWLDLSRVRVEYAGTTSHLFQRFAREYPDVPTFDHGLLSRDEALALQDRASALVVASWNNSKQTGVLTGKVFEYLSRDVPIIGLCAGDIPGSDLRCLIEDCGAGMCYEEADRETYDELVSFVGGLYLQWSEKGLTYRDSRAAERVRRYSYPELAERLVSSMGSCRSPNESPLSS